MAKLIISENEDLVDIETAIGLVAFIVMFIWRIVMLKKVKKDTEKYVDLKF